jgi:hypothetical protein
MDTMRCEKTDIVDAICKKLQEKGKFLTDSNIVWMLSQMDADEIIRAVSGVK